MQRNCKKRVRLLGGSHDRIDFIIKEDLGFCRFLPYRLEMAFIDPHVSHGVDRQNFFVDHIVQYLSKWCHHMMRLVYPVCCGLDVHKKVIVATIVTTDNNGSSSYCIKWNISAGGMESNM